jgi:thiamine pyrophosphokinase
LAAVFLDGSYEDEGFYAGWAGRAGLLVAADGGAAFLIKLGLSPDVVVGDLDSLSCGSLTALAEQGVPVKRFPERKDQTDGELAVDEALARGAGEIVLAGGLGSLDHTLGHLAILRRLASRGVPARLISPELTVRVFVAPAEFYLQAPPRTRVSVVALASDAVVTLQGMEYTLQREVLACDTCRGLGNAVAGETPWARVHRGAVAVLVATSSVTFGGKRDAARP